MTTSGKFQTNRNEHICPKGSFMSTLEKREALPYQNVPRRSKEFDRKMREPRQSLGETGDFLRALQRETDRQMRRTDVALDRLTKQLEALGVTDSLRLFTN